MVFENAMSVESNIEIIHKNISAAAIKSGRNPSDIIIVCISKNRGLEEIYRVLDAGITHIGESRVQEAETKFKALSEYTQSREISFCFHMVGHLQTNKVSKALDIFSMIQSVDSIKLAQKINDISQHRGLKTDILLEVNSLKAASKFGVCIDEAIDYLTAFSKLDSIRVRGLMTMAPLVKDKQDTRVYFRKLRQLRDQIQLIDEPLFKEKIKMDFLSMGMSQDYEIAVEEGANMLRIGTAIFEEPS